VLPTSFLVVRLGELRRVVLLRQLYRRSLARRIDRSGAPWSFLRPGVMPKSTRAERPNGRSDKVASLQKTGTHTRGEGCTVGDSDPDRG
jgi:hypothetical protein